MRAIHTLLPLACLPDLAPRARAMGIDTAQWFPRVLAPSLLHLIFSIFTPIVFSAYPSTHRRDIIAGEKPCVGLDNFARVLSSPGGNSATSRGRRSGQRRLSARFGSSRPCTS